MESRESKEDMMVNFLITATPKKLAEYIDLLENDKEFKNCKFKCGVKRLFVSKVISLLKIKKYILNNRRQKIELDEFQGEIHLYANTKAAENTDSLYEKIYDLHKVKLLELVEKHEAISFPIIYEKELVTNAG